MPAVAEGEKTDEVARRKAATLKALNLSIFMSVVHMVLAVQTEPLMVRKLCNDDLAQTMTALGNTTGLVNFLALFVNQFFGRLSDTVGRRRMFLIGPFVNMLTDALIFARPGKLVLLTNRVVRMAMAGVSSSLMLTASLSDTLSGQELSLAATGISSLVGLAILTTPFVEALVLQRSKPRTVYLVGSVLGAVHFLHNFLKIPETLEVSKRVKLGDSLTLQVLNPFAFLKIFTHGSKSLRKLVCMATLQNSLEGKNTTDFEEFWKRNHLQWGTEACRNELVLYGFCQMTAGMTVHPALLTRLSARGFTSLTNVLNAVAFILRGAREKGLFFLGSGLLLLPGVNGTSALALNSLIADRSKAEGFLAGEFAGYSSQMKAIMRAVTPVFLGNFYAMCLRRKLYPGITFMALAVLGAVLPEALLRLCDSEDLQPPPQRAGGESEEGEEGVAKGEGVDPAAEPGGRDGDGAAKA